MPRMLIITDYKEPYIHEMINGIKRYVFEKQVPHSSICTISPSYKKRIGMEGLAEWCRQWKIDVVLGEFSEDDDVSLLKMNGVLAVATDFSGHELDIPRITAKFEDDGRMAARFFLEKGYRNFGLYTHDTDLTGDRRFKGFREELAEKGTSERCSSFIFREKCDYRAELERLKAWLSNLRKPAAVMVGNDIYGNNLIEYCNVCGIQVPTEIAILGIGNIEQICTMKIISLSSISLDVENVGWKTAEMIHKQLLQPGFEGYDITLKPAVLIERVSTAAVASADLDIQNAVRFIHDNIRTKISVTDILKETALSRRLLEIRFKSVTGKGIYKYISDAKMKIFEHEVMETKKPIQDIAYALGESDTKNLSRKFKEKHGCSPAWWRAGRSRQKSFRE